MNELQQQKEQELQDYLELQELQAENNRRIQKIQQYYILNEERISEEDRKRIEENIKRAKEEMEKAEKIIRLNEDAKKDKLLSVLNEEEEFKRGYDVETPSYLRNERFEHSAPHERSPEDYQPRSGQAPKWKAESTQERMEQDKQEFDEFNKNMREQTRDSSKKDDVPVANNEENEKFYENEQTNDIQQPNIAVESERERKERERNEARDIPDDKTIKEDEKEFLNSFSKDKTEVPDNDTIDFENSVEEKARIKNQELRNQEFERDYEERAKKLREEVQKEHSSNWKQEDRAYSQMEKKEEQFFDKQDTRSRIDIDQKHPSKNMQRMYLNDKEMERGYIKYNGQRIDMDRDTLDSARQNNGRAYLLTVQNGNRTSVRVVEAGEIDRQDVQSQYEKALQEQKFKHQERIKELTQKMKNAPAEQKIYLKELIDKEKRDMGFVGNEYNRANGNEEAMSTYDYMKMEKLEQQIRQRESKIGSMYSTMSTMSGDKREEFNSKLEAEKSALSQEQNALQKLKGNSQESGHQEEPEMDGGRSR